MRLFGPHVCCRICNVAPCCVACAARVACDSSQHLWFEVFWSGQYGVDSMACAVPLAVAPCNRACQSYAGYLPSNLGFKGATKAHWPSRTPVGWVVHLCALVRLASVAECALLLHHGLRVGHMLLLDWSSPGMRQIHFRKACTGVSLLAHTCARSQL